MHNIINYANSLKSRRASALAVVVMVFFLITVFSAIVLSLFNNNLSLTMHQERSTEAYYLAYSGAEIGFAALSADNNDLLNKLKAGTISERRQSITVENGTIEVVATRVNSSSIYYSQYPLWIQITSTGTLSAGGLSRTRILLIDKEDPKNIAWK